MDTQGPKVTWFLCSWSPKSGDVINHVIPLLQDLEGKDHGESSVVGDCQVGKIREGFREDVMLESRSESSRN